MCCSPSGRHLVSSSQQMTSFPSGYLFIGVQARRGSRWTPGERGTQGMAPYLSYETPVAFLGSQHC